MVSFSLIFFSSPPFFFLSLSLSLFPFFEVDFFKTLRRLVTVLPRNVPKTLSELISSPCFFFFLFIYFIFVFYYFYFLFLFSFTISSICSPQIGECVPEQYPPNGYRYFLFFLFIHFAFSLTTYSLKGGAMVLL